MPCRHGQVEHLISFGNLQNEFSRLGFGGGDKASEAVIHTAVEFLQTLFRRLVALRQVHRNVPFHLFGAIHVHIQGALSFRSLYLRCVAKELSERENEVVSRFFHKAVQTITHGEGKGDAVLLVAHGKYFIVGKVFHRLVEIGF